MVETVGFDRIADFNLICKSSEMRTVCFTVSVVALLSADAAAMQLPAPNCPSAIRYWNEAVDCQISEAISPLTWADGFSKGTSTPRQSWNAVKLNGPCPKYSTTPREWRISDVIQNRQIVTVKEIVRRVDMDGRYTGEYTVSKARYVCERRRGQWRIFSKEVVSAAEGINAATASQYQTDRR
ncbi:hypothetical protein [Sphingopyxis sp.]|uniref:hypothetical protein n=1 Tax=Sphingopyxis sp. TaxID=1908224 RepID=UPI002D76B995|nr:hypothetical protein [Sphingopyxis sp.]HET6525616.1 hypothetical protein [Sphingopyxis sp.]